MEFAFLLSHSSQLTHDSWLIIEHGGYYSYSPDQILTETTYGRKDLGFGVRAIPADDDGERHGCGSGSVHGSGSRFQRSSYGN